MTFEKIKPLVTRTAHANTPVEEARTCGVIACKLIVEHAEPPTASLGDPKTLERLQRLIERAAHAETCAEEARTSAVIACRMIVRHEVVLLRPARGFYRDKKPDVPFYGPGTLQAFAEFMFGIPLRKVRFRFSPLKKKVRGIKKKTRDVKKIKTRKRARRT